MQVLGLSCSQACISLFREILYRQNHCKDVSEWLLEEWRGHRCLSGLVDHWHPAVKCGEAGRCLGKDQELLEVNCSPASEGPVGRQAGGSDTLTSSDWDAGMCQGGAERSVGAVGTWDSSHGQNSSPRDWTGRGNVFRSRERGLWPQLLLFCQLLQPFPRSAGEKKESLGHVWLFQLPKLRSVLENWDQVGRSRKTKVNK